MNFSSCSMSLKVFHRFALTVESKVLVHESLIFWGKDPCLQSMPNLMLCKSKTSQVSEGFERIFLIY